MVNIIPRLTGGLRDWPTVCKKKAGFLLVEEKETKVSQASACGQHHTLPISDTILMTSTVSRDHILI